MESETIEYKRELTDGFEKEVLAFLNTQGDKSLLVKTTMDMPIKKRR